MPTRQRSRSARNATPPVLTETALTDGSAEGEGAASLPDVTLHGEPVPVNREALIAIAAYRRAEQRGFEPGYELDDWLAAEREIDASLTSEEPRQ